MIKLFLIKFIKFLYSEHIYEDFSYYTKLGKKLIYPFWFMRMLYIIIFSPIFLFDYFLYNSKTFKMIDDIINGRNISGDKIKVTYIINKKD